MKSLLTTLLPTLLTSLTVLGASPACAQPTTAYPSQAITIVVPQVAGGVSDVIMRRVAQKMADVLGTSIVVDNRPGAGGNIGTTLALSARPDGYTVLMNSINHAINPALYPNAGFDPIDDFIPVGLIARGNLILVVHADLPINSLDELLAEARRAPGSLFYGSGGNGSANHLTFFMLEDATGTQFSHVPYKGQTAVMADVSTGRVPLTFTSLSTGLPYIESGRVRVLAVSNGNRLAVLPDVPSVSEVIPGYDVTPWFGLFVPKGTPEAIVETLHQALNTALGDPELREALEKLGIMPAQESRAAFTDMIAREVTLWGNAVRASGARLD